MAKDSFSIRITFCDESEDFALQFIEFLEASFDGLNIQTPREGSNPKYLPGGKNYDETQGAFKLAYSRLNIKKGKAQLPVFVGKKIEINTDHYR